MSQPQPLVDHRGTTITVGSRVCFNYSGEIAVGVVESVRPAMVDDQYSWKILQAALIKVRQDAPDKGRVSVVRRPKNVMVINEKV